MSRFELTIDTENVAAWMQINNSFRFPDGSSVGDDEYRHGVLIQPGTYEDLATNGQMEALERIDIQVDNSTNMKLSEADLKDENTLHWIDVVRELKPEPMTDAHADSLFPRDAEGRIWTLHRFMTPYNVAVTVWARRYETKTTPYASHAARNVTTSFSFEFDPTKEDCRVALRKKSATGGWTEVFKQDVKDGATIRLVDKAGGPGGTQKNPPQDPPPP